jgi:hypothetical protein
MRAVDISIKTATDSASALRMSFNKNRKFYFQEASCVARSVASGVIINFENGFP